MNLTIEQEEMVEFIEILKVAERDGYKTYIHKENNYGYILNDDYVLYIRKNYFGRWDISFVHKPSRNNDIMCVCYSNLLNVDLETIDKAFIIGCSNASNSKAKKYKNSQEWFNQYWDKGNLNDISRNPYY